MSFLDDFDPLSKGGAPAAAGSAAPADKSNKNAGANVGWSSLPTGGIMWMPDSNDAAAPKKKAGKKAAKKKKDSDDEDSDDEVEDTRKKVAAAKVSEEKKPTPAKKKPAKKKEESDDESESESDESDDDNKKKKAAPAKKKPAPAKEGQSSAPVSEEGKAEAKKKVAKKKKESDSESESDSASESDSDEENKKKKKAAAAKKKAAPAKKKDDEDDEPGTGAKKAKAAPATKKEKCAIKGCQQFKPCPIHQRDEKPKAKSPEMWTIHFSRTSTSMGLNKNCIVWRVWDRGVEYEIELFHSTFGGKRVIKINGSTYVNEKKALDNGSRYDFRVGDGRTILSVELRPAGLVGFTYELYVNGKPYDEAKRYWLLNEKA